MSEGVAVGTTATLPAPVMPLPTWAMKSPVASMSAIVIVKPCASGMTSRRRFGVIVNAKRTVGTVAL